MTQPASITVEQAVAAAPDVVWRFLTEPALVAAWWAPGDIAPVVGHRFTLDMPGFGTQPCEVLEVAPGERFVYRFTESWTLTWQLTPDGAGTTVRLDHDGFDLNDPMGAFAHQHMGPGWRDVVLPRLAEAAAADVP